MMMALLLMQSAFNLGLVAILVAAVVASWVVMYAVMRQNMEQTRAELRQEFEERLHALMIPVRPAPQERAAGSAASFSPAATASAAQTSAVAEARAVAQAAQPAGVAPALPEEIAPETLLVIAAAVTAYLGKKVRIRSAKVVYSNESYNSWSQQGRVFVQASHNLAQRGF
jgi:uncharacterized membrane-anchored protein